MKQIDKNPNAHSFIRKEDAKDVNNYQKMILFVKKKLEELDQHIVKNEYDKIEEKKKELEEIRNEFQNLSFLHDDELSTYPEVTDPEFAKKIFYKKEFHKNKYLPIDTSKSFVQLSQEECSQPQGFRLTPNQIFLKNYMSTRTPYRNVLLFHGVGVGKCHAKDTNIFLYNGEIKKVQDVTVGDELMGDDSTPRVVQSLARGHDTMYRVNYGKNLNLDVNSEHILVMILKRGLKFFEIYDKKRQKFKYIVVFVSHLKLVYYIFENYKTASIYYDRIYRNNNYKHEFIFHISISDYIKLPSIIRDKIFMYRSPIVRFKHSHVLQSSSLLLKFVFRLGRFSAENLLLNTLKSIYESRNNDNFMTTIFAKNSLHKFQPIKKYCEFSMTFHSQCLRWIKFGSWKIRQYFMAGFLYIQSCIPNVKKGYFYFDKDVDFIAKSVGICTKLHKNEIFDSFGSFSSKCLQVQDAEFNKFQSKRNILENRRIVSFYLNDFKSKNENKHDYRILLNGLYKRDFTSYACRIHVRKIQENQEYYGFVLDGNSRYIVEDFIVTHNTCSAITIAEQYSDVFEKPALVLSPKSLKDNFRKQIFDINQPFSCTGNKYPNLISQYAKKKEKVREFEINKKINERYNFFAFLEFAKKIERIEEQMCDKFPNDMNRQKKEVADVIRNIYSNRVIIIDEVHNVRSDEEDKNASKLAPKKILQVLQTADNVVLILLSATPMFNSMKEIVWILNFLLANDKRPLLNSSEIFHNNNLTNKGEKMLEQVSRSYVSYMRGQNPFSFPFTLFPNINNDLNILQKKHVPSINIKGEKIPEDKRLNDLIGKLVVNTLSPYQYETYAYLKNEADDKREQKLSLNEKEKRGRKVKYQKKAKNKNSSNAIRKEDEDEDDEDDSEFDDFNDNKETYSKKKKKIKENENENENFMSNTIEKLLQCSIITFPTKSKDNRTRYGSHGFDNCFDTIGKNKTSDQKNIQFLYKPFYQDFLSYENLENYSTKLKMVVDYILNSEGIVFVYSRYLKASLYPLAIALEHVGFSMSHGGHLLAGSRNKKISYSVKTENGIFKPKYSILTGNTQMNIDIPKEIEKIKTNNRNGEQVKVILGTAVSAEGINFKNIRQVHILEPWFHLNRNGQVIGRAIRKCSHQELPPEKRNVTVYQHASILPSKNSLFSLKESKKKDKDIVESIDLRLYTLAENKQKTIDKIEYILKKNAIDCALNKNRLFYPANEMNIYLSNIETSQRNILKNYKVGDDENESKEPLTCSFSIDVNKEKHDVHLDVRTFHSFFLEDDIQEYIDYIKYLYQNMFAIFSLKGMIYYLEKVYGNIDTDVLKFTLDHMLNNRTPIFNRDGEEGFIIYFNNKYMFQPRDAPYTYFTKRDRKDYLTKMVNQVIIDHKEMVSRKYEILDAINEKFLQNDETNDLGFNYYKMKRKEKNALHTLFSKSNKILQETLNHVIPNEVKNMIKDDQSLLNVAYLLDLKSKVSSHVFEKIVLILLTATSYSFDRSVERDMIRIVEEVLASNTLFEMSNNQSLNNNNFNNSNVNSLSKRDLKKKMLDINDIYSLVYFMLIYNNYIVVLNDGNKVFRNPFLMNTSLEFFSSENALKKIRNEDIENSLMVFDEKEKKLQKIVLFQMTNLLNSDEMKSSFRNIANINSEKLEGFMSMNFSEKTDKKNVTFKIVGENQDKGADCGTGKVHSHGNLYDRVVNIDKSFVLSSMKKDELCLIYELLLRYVTFKGKKGLFMGVVHRFYFEMKNKKQKNKNLI